MTYDVAIIGAGPAGAVFAKVLAEKRPDLKILLVDGQTERTTKVCGGLLGPDAQELLAKFDLTLPKSVLTDPQIFAVDTIDLGASVRVLYQRHYLNMDRLAFDKWLVDQIPEGVDILSGRCVSIEQSSGCDTEFTLTVNLGQTKTTLTAWNIVGADGGSSFVRRRFFKSRLLRYVAIQQWFEIQDERLPNYSCIFDRETSDSCSWTIKKDGYFIFGGAFRKKNCREAFDKQKKKLQSYLGVELGEPMKTEATQVCSPRRMSDFLVGKERIYLLGEAAGFISSSSFEGISSAILSGKLLADSFAEGDTPRGVLKKYKSKTKKLRMKLYLKIPKMKLLCSPLFRKLIMKSGFDSIERF